MPLELFAPVAKGLAGPLAEELRGLGAIAPRTAAAGVSFTGELELAYRACLWSRLASRVLLVLGRVEAMDADGLYAGVRSLPWDDHLGPDDTLAVDFTGTSPALSHTHFNALKVKDAIVDHFRDRCGRRPNIDTADPAVRVNVHLELGTAVVCIDLSGDPLHRRGYRSGAAEAPLKETLAAAMLRVAGWPGSGALVDPLCGSGTLLIEAALMAADAAPALDRARFGFRRWRGHQPEVWARLLDEARQRRRATPPNGPVAWGFDADPLAVTTARANARRAGVAEWVQVQTRPLADWLAPGAAPPVAAASLGRVVTNPPYGHRLTAGGDPAAVYRQLAAVLRACFAGVPAAVLAPETLPAAVLGLPVRRQRRLFNGPLACCLYELDTAAPPPASGAGGSGSMFVNRLLKNLRHTGRWARREGISCYRLYDADMPEFAVAVDVYTDLRDQVWAVVQEYQAPRGVDPARAAGRLEEALAGVRSVLELPLERLVLKVRQRQRGAAQYGRQGSAGQLHAVREGGLTFLVNFTDYLDTGLFLGHRQTRALIRTLAPGRAFLNLFGYTGSATVYAAAGGATRTTTVDLSPVYLDWAHRNLQANHLDRPVHERVRADCRPWLAEPRRERYGLILLDPPTFSNSKRMSGTLDIQRDHGELLASAARLLTPDGILLVSTNSRGFVLDSARLSGWACTEITRQTHSLDFAGRSAGHRSWRLTRALS